MERIGAMHWTPPGEDEQDEQSEYLPDHPQEKKQRRTPAERTQKLPEYDEESNTYRPIKLRASRPLNGNRHELETVEPVKSVESVEKGRKRPLEQRPHTPSRVSTPAKS